MTRVEGLAAAPAVTTALPRRPFRPGRPTRCPPPPTPPTAHPPQAPPGPVAGGWGGSGNPLAPQFCTGGIQLLRQESLRERDAASARAAAKPGMAGCAAAATANLGGILHDDTTLSVPAVSPATVAAIRSEWLRVGSWDIYDCPPRVLSRQTPADMRASLQRALLDAREKPNLLVNRGRGRAKTRHVGSAASPTPPPKKYTDVLSEALRVLDSVDTAKQRELSNRLESYSAVETGALCTCFMGSSPQVVCRVCRSNGRKDSAAHSVRLRRSSATEAWGLRLVGEWALVLAGLHPSRPAASCGAIGGFLKHRILHVDGKLVAGTRQVLHALDNGQKEVELAFYSRYMSIEDTARQYRQQMIAGRAEVASLLPSNIPHVVRSMSPTAAGLGLLAKPLRVSGVIESSLQRIANEPKLEHVRRRWHTAFGKRLNLENLCRSRPQAWPAIFRLVSEGAQGKAIAAAAKSAKFTEHPGVPPRGLFKAGELRLFYPPLTTAAARDGLTQEMSRALLVISKFIEDPRLDIFKVVVDEEGHGAPQYYHLIARPVDFVTILNRIRSHLYASAAEVKSDCDLVWSNCRLYNPHPHWLFDLSQTLEREFNEAWKEAKVNHCQGRGAARTPRANGRGTSHPASRSESAAKLQALLASSAAYSATYSKLFEKIGSEMYDIVVLPGAGPGSIDLAVQLSLANCSDLKILEIIASLDKGFEVEQRKLKKARNDHI